MSLSKRQKRKRIKSPRATRMRRPARLQSAKRWLETYSGKNVLRSYGKHFAVDWRCAALELQLLGIKIDPAYLKQRELSEQNRAAAATAAAAIAAEAERCRNEELRQLEDDPDGGDMIAAYLEGDFPALHVMECERDGVDPMTGLPIDDLVDAPIDATDYPHADRSDDLADAADSIDSPPDVFDVWW